ncbi:VIT domain-containing protein [Anaeromyxobacter oryzae]|uniref:VIT domain-containing protein n=1 Tax=Anaeromyxobacter oryzae TaxID=2918170 RepID=UPI00207C7A81|nr:VIT domain-containing protein [Anaeromyxobacter oryzae]
MAGSRAAVGDGARGELSDPGSRAPVGDALIQLPAAKADAPLALTASDGTGLVLEAVDARAVVNDPLAFTELHLTFRNPEDRVLEGQFRITLPRGASLSRFAMWTGAAWQEGEVVELQAARRAYEDFLHRRQDPALLEQAPGNAFSARVFPIPARGTKELVVSWSQELAGAGSPFVLPLAGLPRLGRLDVRVIDETSGAPRVLERHETAFAPTGDLALRPARRVAGLRAGDLAVVRVRPVDAAEADPVRNLVVLVDTSASRALGLGASLDLVSGLARGLGAAAGPDAPFALAVFDQDAELVHDGRVAGLAPERIASLRARGALGASDLAGALRSARTWLARAPGRYTRVVLVTDGVVTAGPEDGVALARAALALRDVGAERIDAVAVGGIRDEASLARIVTAGLARDGAVIDGTAPAAEVLDRLGRATRSGLAVAAEGARWVWPGRLDGVQAGEDVLVYASIPEHLPVRLTVGGRTFTPAVVEVAPPERPLVGRASARARIAAMLGTRDRLPETARAEREALRRSIVDVSVGARVLSPFTALLVLETEADYARAGIDRRALADVLVVGDRGLALLDRRTVAGPLQLAGKHRGAAAVERDAAPDLRADPRAVPVAAPSAAGAGATVASAAAPRSAERMTSAAPTRDEAYRVEEAKEAAPAVAAEPLPRPGALAPGAPPVAAPAPALRTAPSARRNDAALEIAGDPDPGPFAGGVAPYTGRFAQVMSLLQKNLSAPARKAAEDWVASSPGDVLALVALGEACERAGELRRAARAYGSLIDLFPNRADLRRFAGERLERLPMTIAGALAVDTYRKAAAQRPDHPASHRLLGFALLRAGDLAGAFDALATGLAREYPEGRFAGAHQILAEDLGLVAAAWSRAEPKRAAGIAARLAAAGGTREDGPSLRFVLTWETDANDVDFHVVDGAGARAFYGNPELASGGRLYADVTTGYGPECFTIRGTPAGFPYQLGAHYYARGPMGYGMGKLEIVRHDGRGNLRFEERPFVVMQDRAFVDLGVLER